MEQFTEKLETKHGVYPNEVKEVFSNHPKIRRLEKGGVRGEDFYRALGQTSSGRYLAVFFVYKPRTRSALVISSRDMTYKLMLRSLSWERRHPAGLPPGMAAFPVRNISYKERRSYHE